MNPKVTSEKLQFAIARDCRIRAKAGDAYVGKIYQQLFAASCEDGDFSWANDYIGFEEAYYTLQALNDKIHGNRTKSTIWKLSLSTDYKIVTGPEMLLARLSKFFDVDIVKHYMYCVEQTSVNFGEYKNFHFHALFEMEPGRPNQPGEITKRIKTMFWDKKLGTPACTELKNLTPEDPKIRRQALYIHGAKNLNKKPTKWHSMGVDHEMRVRYGLKRVYGVDFVGLTESSFKDSESYRLAQEMYDEYIFQKQRSSTS